MNLGIQLITGNLEWRALLDQAGISWSITTPEQLSVKTAPAAVLHAPLRPPQRQPVRKYLSDGGTLIMEADMAEEWLNIPLRTQRIRHLNTSADPQFASFPALNFPYRTRVARSANHLPDQNGIPTIALISHGGGRLMVLPGGFSAALGEYRTGRVNFPDAGGARLPSERVVRVSKGGLRLILLRLLCLDFHQRGLPLVYKWPFPTPTESCFGFRIDTDFATPAAIDALYQLLDTFRIPATWFVETKSAESWIGRFAGMKNQEIALHCYRHLVRKKVAANIRDIRKGLAILGSAGLSPKGYAAPFGEWNPALGRALDSLNFRFSSEFAQSYDALPFFPVITHTGPGSTLQVPIHPISVGRLRWARHTPTQMVNYFLNLIQRNCSLHEPIFLYTHPGQGKLEVFERIFEEIQRMNMPMMSMGAYAEWWKNRNAHSFQCRLNETQPLVNTSATTADSIWLCVHYPDQHPGLHALRDGALLTGNGLKTLTPQNWRPPDPARINRRTGQMFVHDLTWHYSRWKQRWR